jgi:hypothetical protein
LVRNLSRANGLHRNEIGLRHFGNDAADIVEGLGGGCHRGTRQNGLHKRAPLDAVSGFVARVKGKVISKADIGPEIRITNF